MAARPTQPIPPPRVLPAQAPKGLANIAMMPAKFPPSATSTPTPVHHATGQFTPNYMPGSRVLGGSGVLPSPRSMPSQQGTPVPYDSSMAHHPHHPALAARQPSLAPAPPGGSGVLPPPHQAHPAMVPATPGGTPSQYHPPSHPPQVYTLPPALDAALPKQVRDAFHTDDAGRLLLFTRPSLDRPHPGVGVASHGLGHSVSFLADRQRLREERERKRKERDEAAAANVDANAAAKRRTPDRQLAEQSEEDEAAAARALGEALGTWVRAMDEGTAWIKAGLSGWEDATERRQKQTQGVAKPAVADVPGKASAVDARS